MKLDFQKTWRNFSSNSLGFHAKFCTNYNKQRWYYSTGAWMIVRNNEWVQYIENSPGGWDSLVETCTLLHLLYGTKTFFTFLHFFLEHLFYFVKSTLYFLSLFLNSFFHKLKHKTDQFTGRNIPWNDTECFFFHLITWQDYGQLQCFLPILWFDFGV